MLIRQATLEDIPVIKRIVESRLKKDFVPDGSGFFRLDLMESDYRVRIDNNPLALVAEYEGPAGFLMGYTSSRLRELARTNKIAASDKLIARALRFGDPFVYVDILAVLKEHERHGIGPSLDDRALGEAESLGICRIYGAIADENTRVIEFYNRRGQDFVCRIEGTGFSMYTRDLMKIRAQSPKVSS